MVKKIERNELEAAGRKKEASSCRRPPPPAPPRPHDLLLSLFSFFSLEEKVVTLVWIREIVTYIYIENSLDLSGCGEIRSSQKGGKRKKKEAQRRRKKKKASNAVNSAFLFFSFSHTFLPSSFIVAAQNEQRVSRDETQSKKGHYIRDPRGPVEQGRGGGGGGRAATTGRQKRSRPERLREHCAASSLFRAAVSPLRHDRSFSFCFSI